MTYKKEEKPTASQIQEKIDRTINHESNKILRDYIKFAGLPFLEQQKCRDDRDSYYEKIKQTPIYALFQEQRKALSENNFARVKELALQAKSMRENGDSITLAKPVGRDPWEYSYASVVYAYKALLNDKAQTGYQEKQNFTDF